MFHVTIIRVYTTRIAKQHNKLLINILLLLLFLPIYRGMCPSVPTHIHPYMSKLRLLLKTDDELTDYVYSGSRAYRNHDPGCFVARVRNLPQGYRRWVLYYAHSGL